MIWWSTLAHYLAANWLEVAGFITTVVGIWLTTRRLLICWPIVLAADIIYLIQFHNVMLLSDAMLQVFYVGFTLYGWWYWWRGAREEGQVRVVTPRASSLLMALTAGAVGGLALGIVTMRLHAALPFLDGSLASFSLVASWWQARKYPANWWLWIIVDAIYVPEYIYKDMWLTAILYAGLVILAVMGLRDWRRAAANQMAACTTLSSGSPAI